MKSVLTYFTCKSLDGAEQYAGAHTTRILNSNATRSEMMIADVKVEVLSGEEDVE